MMPSGKRKVGARILVRLKRAACVFLPDKTIGMLQRRRLEGRQNRIPASYSPAHTYSVVTAAYNAAPYLDAYFESLTTQTATLSHLQIVVVDDCSDDETAQTVERWQRRFPQLVEYRRNGKRQGQGHSRNIGLSYATGEWVTFIDADDFVSSSYIERIDRLVMQYPDMQFVSCRMVFFYEEKQRYEDGHPLAFQFERELSLYDARDERHSIQLSMSSAFFKRERIEELGLRIDERIRPCFEDAHFLNRYLLHLDAGHLAWVRDSIYYYRKRRAGNSTIDRAWQDPAHLTITPRYGYLDLLRRAKAICGHVPRFVQSVVFYDLCCYFRRLENRPDHAAFFSEDAQEDFWKTLYDIFSYIDVETVEEMPGRSCDFEHAWAVLRFFKDTEPAKPAVRTRFDKVHGTLTVVSVSPDFELSCDGRHMRPTVVEEYPVFFLGRHTWSNYVFEFSGVHKKASLSCFLEGRLCALLD